MNKALIFGSGILTGLLFIGNAIDYAQNRYLYHFFPKDFACQRTDELRKGYGNTFLNVVGYGDIIGADGFYIANCR